MTMFSLERILALSAIQFLGASTVENTPAGPVIEDIAVKSSLTVRRVCVSLVVSLEKELPIKDFSKRSDRQFFVRRRQILSREN